MKRASVRNASRGRPLGDRVAVADRWWLRLRGLLGRPALEPGEGLLLTPCTAIHMHGMRASLDVVFLDRDARVVALYRELPPGARTRWHRASRHALELPAGTLTATGTELGDQLTWTVAPTSQRPRRRALGDGASSPPPEPAAAGESKHLLRCATSSPDI